MANQFAEANEHAWREYMGSQTYQAHREDFDNGWNAALAYIRNVQDAERRQLVQLLYQQQKLISEFEALRERGGMARPMPPVAWLDGFNGR